MARRGTLASSVSLLLLILLSACHGLIETCEDLQAAFDLTKTQDVIVQIHPYQDIECAEFTTMSMDSNSLTVESNGANVFNPLGGHDLSQMRFEVTNGAKLTWEMNARFSGPDGLDFNGGALHVGEGSTVRFLNNLQIVDYGIRSLRDDGDYSSYELSGGCVYTDGYFRVDGEASFSNCKVTGGGEGGPGPGGALYVGTEGSVLFNGELYISEVSIIDDDGGVGGAIFNAGKVNIKGDATFENLIALSGGAIYNTEDAQFRFKNGAKAFFIHCTAYGGTAGAVYNRGYFEFSGPALFVDIYIPAIVVSSRATKTVLSENSAFWDSYVDSRAAIKVSPGGQLTIPDSVVFIDSETDCSRVNFMEDDACE